MYTPITVEPHSERRIALPISKFFDWRNHDKDNVIFIKTIINKPIEDVDELAEEVYWCDDWGKNQGMK